MNFVEMKDERFPERIQLSKLVRRYVLNSKKTLPQKEERIGNKGIIRREPRPASIDSNGKYHVFQTHRKYKVNTELRCREAYPFFLKSMHATETVTRAVDGSRVERILLSETAFSKAYSKAFRGDSVLMCNRTRE